MISFFLWLYILIPFLWLTSHFFLHLLLFRHRKTKFFQAKLESWLCCSLLCPELFFLSLRWSLQWHQGLRSTQGFFWVLKLKIGIKCYNIIIVQFKCSFASSQKCPNCPNWYLSHSEMKPSKNGQSCCKMFHLYNFKNLWSEEKMIQNMKPPAETSLSARVIYLFLSVP